MRGVAGAGVVGLVATVVSSTVLLLEELPPPQPTSVSIVESSVAIVSRVKGLKCVELELSIEKLFSIGLHYFIVGRMNVIALTDKLTAAQSALYRITQYGLSMTAALLLLLPYTAHAEWQKVTSTDSGIIYVDDGTIKRAGPIRSFWSLLDYRTPQKAQRGAYFVSTRTHMEMDCRKEMVHILQFSMHSGPMLTGEIVDSQGVMREWQTIPPDTPLVSLFKFVCGK